MPSIIPTTSPAEIPGLSAGDDVLFQNKTGRDLWIIASPLEPSVDAEAWEIPKGSYIQIMVEAGDRIWTWFDPTDLSLAGDNPILFWMVNDP